MRETRNPIAIKQKLEDKLNSMKSITFNQFCVSVNLCVITVALLHAPRTIAEERPAVSNPRQMLPISAWEMVCACGRQMPKQV